MGAKYPSSISLPSSNGGRDVETTGTKLLKVGFVVGLEKGFKDGEDNIGANFTP